MQNKQIRLQATVPKSTGRAYLGLFSASVAAMVLGLSPSAVTAEPGRGATGRFEVRLMQFIIDHHFTALRATELAAGTDPSRNGQLQPNEGTSPTPGYQASRPKATLDEIKSIARAENRMQREQIMELQRYLRDWYGIAYEPRIRYDGRQLITTLEQAQPGASFDRAFLEQFSRHHYSLLEPVSACITGVDRRHDALTRLCTQMWHAQTSGIDEMRELLETRFGITDFQPFHKDVLTP